MAKPRILVAGASVVNFLLRSKSVPGIGEKHITNHPYSFVPGGRGLISAISSARLDSDVVFSTCVGNDFNGDFLKSVFLNNKIDQRFVVTDKKKMTALDTIIYDNSGDSRVISHPGAAAVLSEENIEEAFMSYPDFFLLHSELNDSLVYEAISIANKKNVPVLFDPAGIDIDDIDYDALGEIEIFTPNAEEAYQISKIMPGDVESCLHACIRIINRIKCHYVVIKLGAKGCFVFDGVYSEVIPAFDTNEVDRRGAGAVFNAGLASMLLKTNDIIKSSVFANAASALCVSSQGEFSSIPENKTVLDFIDKNKISF